MGGAEGGVLPQRGWVLNIRGRGVVLCRHGYSLHTRVTTRHDTRILLAKNERAINEWTNSGIQGIDLFDWKHIFGSARLGVWEGLWGCGLLHLLLVCFCAP